MTTHSASLLKNLLINYLQTVENDFKNKTLQCIETLLENYPDPITIRQRLERLVRIQPKALMVVTEGDDRARQVLLTYLTLGEAALEELIKHPHLLTSFLDIEKQGNVFHDAPSPIRDLAYYKRLIWIRILLRERLGLADIDETNADLSALADKVAWYAFELNGYDEPPLALFAMGKWGGRELNASSDIDPVFFALNESKSINGDPIVRKWAHTLAGNSGDHIYPVDLRLRPEGRSGPMVCSVSEAERYFFQRAAAWERIAYLRARHVFGEIPNWFSELLDSFLFGLNYSPQDRVREVAQSLLSIHKTAARRDIKRSPGGIRDVEFLVASLQLSEGRENLALRNGTIVELLQTLNKSGFLSDSESVTLIDGYRFLRRTENFLQAEEDRPQFKVPEQNTDIHARLAYALGYSSATYEVKLKTVRAEVSGLIQKYLLSELKNNFSSANLIDPQSDSEPNLNSPVIRRLSGKWGNATKLFDELVLQDKPDSDEALIRLESVVQAYGGPESWLKAFGDNKKVLNVLTKIILHGKRLVDEANVRPYLWEKIGLENWEEIHSTHTSRDYSNYLGDYLFHLGESFISGKLEVMDFAHQWSLAVETVMQNVGKNLLETPLPIAVIALGKWGGGELAPDADLDVMLVSEEGNANQVAEAAQNGMLWLKEASLDGRMLLDARLRPEGSGAPMVITLSRLEEYLSSRGQAWEKIALIRARCVAGDSSVGKKSLKIIRGFTTSVASGSEIEQIDRARKKTALEAKARKGIIRIKKAMGGMMDFEFASNFGGWLAGVEKNSDFWSKPIPTRLEDLAEMLENEKLNEAAEAYRVLRLWEMTQLLSSTQRKGDISLKGDSAEKFASAMDSSVIEITSEWQRISKIGREIYQQLKTELNEKLS